MKVVTNFLVGQCFLIFKNIHNLLCDKPKIVSYLKIFAILCLLNYEINKL